MSKPNANKVVTSNQQSKQKTTENQNQPSSNSNDKLPVQRLCALEVPSNQSLNRSNQTPKTLSNDNNSKKRKIEVFVDTKQNVEPEHTTHNKNTIIAPLSLNKNSKPNKTFRTVLHDDDDEDDDFLNFIECKRKPKQATLKDLSDKDFLSKCCWSNRSPNNKLASCSHEIKWFVGNEPLDDLLQLTCKEAKNLFKKFKESGKTQETDENCLLFERKRDEGQAELKSLNTSMHFKFDYEHEKFCIYKID